jgi:hypothetical protein
LDKILREARKGLDKGKREKQEMEVGYCDIVPYHTKSPELLPLTWYLTSTTWELASMEVLARELPLTWDLTGNSRWFCPQTYPAK